MLRKRQSNDGVRFTSERRIGSWPLYDIIVKPGSNDLGATARGILAGGPKAVGIFAVGGFATGVVSIGGITIGVFSMGGVSVGLITAMGGLAVGSIAFGGLAIGGMCMAGLAIGIVPFGAGNISLARKLGIAIGQPTVRSMLSAAIPLSMFAALVPVGVLVWLQVLTSMLSRRSKAG